MLGLLIPPHPWTGRLVAASAKAISIIHPDGAMISVVGRPADMEARAMMPAEGFSDFAARAAGMIEDCRGNQAGLQLLVSWDGQCLLLAPSMLDFGRSPAIWDPRGRLATSAERFLHCYPRGMIPAGADPDSRASAGELALCESLAAELRTLLAEAYAAGRRAEGLHGSGAFARGVRRLQAHPDFPAVVVGFGPGTTPAGDDWLAGCLVALDLRAGGPGRAATALRQKIRDRLAQTTAAGKSLLIGAVAGTPPEYLVALAEAAADWVAVNVAVLVYETARVTGRFIEQAAGQVSGPGSLRVAVSKCLEHGATSGEDALAGFVYGLETDTE